MLSILAPASPGEIGCADYYGLSVRPFSPALDQRFVYPTRSWMRAVSDVRQALQQRDGVVVITGAAGTGKTLLCRTLLHQLDETPFVSVVLDPCGAAEDLLAQVLEDFGVLRAGDPLRGTRSRTGLVGALQRFLRSLIPEKGHAVIVIDEAQHLAPEVLEQLRLLTNFETDEAKLLQVVLVGQPDLERRLREPGLQALDQRVARRCTLQPLAGHELKRYIERRLSTAQRLALVHDGRALGWEAAERNAAWRIRFTPSAVRAVAALSAGVPRVVNLVCDRALDVGYERRRRQIDARIVNAAARRLELPSARRSSWTALAAAPAAAGLLVLGSVTWMWAERPASAPAPLVPAASSRSEVAAGSKRALPGPLPVAGAYHVRAGAFRTATRAATAASHLQALGLPSFVEEDGPWHHVVVGPYVSEPEAAVAQRGLVAQGFTTANVFTAGTGAPPAPAAEPRADGVVLLASGRRLSLVFELAEEPRTAVAHQVDGTTLRIEAGPVIAPRPPRRLTPSSDTSMVEQVLVEEVTPARANGFLRARVTLREPGRSNVRVVGRRVYVDVTQAAPPPAAAVADRVAPRAAAYHDTVAPLAERLAEIEPFLLSAASAPTAEVLGAVEQTLSTVDASLRAMDVPVAVLPSHTLLLTAVAQATRAVARDFGGDRVAHARHACALMRQARAQLLADARAPQLAS